MKLGPFRLNLSKRGIGYSVGVPGARITVGADGRVTQTVGIQGTGISHRETLSGGGLRTVAARTVPYHPGRPAPGTAPSFLVGVLFAFGIIMFSAGLLSTIGEAAMVLMPLFILGALVLPFVLYARRKGQWRHNHERARERYIQGLIDHFGEDIARALVIGDPWQGATQEMASIMFGPPVDISTHVYKTKTKHTWKYAPLDARRYAMKLEFENGVCVGWQLA